jgi:hypothetical protein
MARQCYAVTVPAASIIVCVVKIRAPDLAFINDFGIDMASIAPFAFDTKNPDPRSSAKEDIVTVPWIKAFHI